MCILMVPFDSLAISKLVCMHGITVLEPIVSCDNINNNMAYNIAQCASVLRQGFAL